jgi:flagellar biosynthesis/type III secretory pathway protein FliH
MSFHLIHADAATLLASDRAVIKRDQRETFTDALSLLRQAGEVRAAADADAESARAEGYAQGLAEAQDAARQSVIDHLGEMTAAIDRHIESRRVDIADAAFAATRAIIGAFEETETLNRIVDRAIARLTGDGPVTIEVAPDSHAAVAQHVGKRAHLALVADPELGPTDCRVRSEQGQIIASLSVQLDALAARWGVQA